MIWVVRRFKHCPSIVRGSKVPACSLVSHENHVVEGTSKAGTEEVFLVRDRGGASVVKGLNDS